MNSPHSARTVLLLYKEGNRNNVGSFSRFYDVVEELKCLALRVLPEASIYQTKTGKKGTTLILILILLSEYFR
jgi:hypothetical protein